MFDMDLQGKIRAISAKVKDNDGEIERYCLLSLQFEFTKELAGALNGDAKSLQKQLASGSLASAKLAMDAVDVAAEFDAGESEKLTLDGARGVSVSLKRVNKEDAHPTARLTLRFATEKAALLYFVNHLEETVGVRMNRVQTELSL